MNVLDKFRYSKDDPLQLNISLKKDPYEKSNNNNGNNLNQLLSTSVKVSKEIFPTIYSAIENVFNRLKIKNNLNFFVTANHLQVQATCSAMPMGDSAEIILTSKLVELLNEEELESIIAHEVAHFYYQHALYPQASNSKSRTEILNLLNFSRAAEISADRIGFIGCGSLEASLRAMLKITSGLDEKHLKFNFSSYLNQLRELADVKGDQTQLYSTHPTFLNRMQALIWFSMSHEYHEFFETDKKGIYDLKTVDKKIDESIKKVTGGEIDISNKEIIDKALLWGALWIYLADKKFSKEEQEKFSKRFGDKATVSIKSLLNISKISVIEKKVSEAYASASTLLKSEKEKIITKIKEIYSEADEHNDKSKEILEKIIKLLNG